VSPGGSDFVMRLTINESQVFRIITNDNFEYDYSVDWGDGTITANHSEDAQNTYLTAGVYEITVSGDYPAFKFCENNDGCSDFKLDILHWGSNQWRSMESTFSGLNAITILAQDIPDFSSTTNLSFMFYKTPNFNSDISSWDTSNITDMNFMFGFASSFNGDIARWDTSSVTNMGGLFYFAESFNNDISQWNTSAVTRMHSLFAFATKFNTDISQWDTSSVTYMATMFLGASNFNGTLSNWDVSKVYDMSKMFYNATSMTGDLRTWVLASGVRHSSFTHKDSLLIEPNW
jgi:surface protein